jgi:sodium-coupled neutral amino acid transporter 11
MVDKEIATLPSLSAVNPKKKLSNSANERSPFFHPSAAARQRIIKQPSTTLRGAKSVGHVRKPPLLDDEHKTGIFGTSANLVVTIVGAGIVGIPYAMKKSGMVAGTIMTVLSAAACDKSLRLLIETAKHVDVTSYETLFEAAFGSKGFQTMCGIMFAISYGATISYLMIIKDMLSLLIGLDDEADESMKRAAMVIATLVVALPLSSQRDMADLAKTSRFSVIFYLCIVLFIAMCSPISASVQSNGGWGKIVTQTMFRPQTFFSGFGVLTFAFVCQHSAFILAGSLERPTKQRWASVAHFSLTISGALAVICGVAGYLAFLDETDGNILNNMKSLQDPLMTQLNRIAQGMLLVCMFFVYPLEAFVLRHVSMVLFFKGRAAHEGFDHLVLARPDRRFLLTFGVYMLTLLPALLLQNLGAVLSVTGSVAGSSLSYICPGLSFLSIHGAEFKKLVHENWVWGNPSIDNFEAAQSSLRSKLVAIIKFLPGRILWYLCLMPIWITIADLGQQNMLDFAEKEALKSPAPLKPLGKIAHKRCLSDRAMGLHTPDLAALKIEILKQSGVSEKSPLLRVDLEAEHLIPQKYSGDNNINRKVELSMERSTAGFHGTSADNNLKGKSSGNTKLSVDVATVEEISVFASSEEIIEEEDDPQSTFPKVYDFVLAISFISFGALAMIAGLYSVFTVSL